MAKRNINGGKDSSSQATRSLSASPFGFGTRSLVAALGLQARYLGPAGPGEVADPLMRAGWRYVGEKVQLLLKNRGFVRALRAILDKRLDSSRGMDPMYFIAMLAALAVHGRVPRTTRDWMLALGTGRTAKALCEFPGRLRSMADDVEQVSRGVLFNPGHAGENDTEERELALLPGRMRAVAGHLERVLEKLRSIFPPSSRAARGHSEFALYLSRSVKLLTGRYHDREVVELLNAASAALDTEVEFDLQTLADLRQRHKLAART